MRRMFWIVSMVVLGLGFNLSILSIGHAETTKELGAIMGADKKIPAHERLELSSVSGKAPLTIRVVDPNSITRLGVGRPQKWIGCGMYVNWGDGPTEYVQECSEYLTHVYKTAGIFIVKATLWHPGPDDDTVIDWEDTTQVTVK